ncbi:unnamed protein product [Danaus chrysippus]|uniref:(African queen) hypothetical protein n=1 Tax=Danaus chrysippus TaxID=151541 RepID=A0A8J2QP80_9NEOP|nr:unnamed protein product [Danaus chrysippus]
MSQDSKKITGGLGGEKKFSRKKHHMGGHYVTDTAGMCGLMLPARLVTLHLSWLLSFRLHQAATHSDESNSFIHCCCTSGRLQMEKVAAVNTSAASEGWLEFNVTSALATWLGAPADKTMDFSLLFTHIRNQNDTSKPEDIGIQETHGNNTEAKQPFMVAFFKNGPKLGSADSGARKKREAKTAGGIMVYSENYLRNPLTGNLKDWIIAPDLDMVHSFTAAG